MSGGPDSAAHRISAGTAQEQRRSSLPSAMDGASTRQHERIVVMHARTAAALGLVRGTLRIYAARTEYGRTHPHERDFSIERAIVPSFPRDWMLIKMFGGPLAWLDYVCDAAERRNVVVPRLVTIDEVFANCRQLDAELNRCRNGKRAGGG